MLNYDLEENIQLHKNILSFTKDIKNNIFDSKLLEKIKNYSVKYNLEEEFIINELRSNNEFYIKLFVKEPIKQSFHQNTAIKYLQSLNYISNAKLLPASGTNCLFIVNGDILTNVNKKHTTHKSIDFYWENGGTKFYASHKYTRFSGGSQDHQFNEAKNFLFESQYNKDDSVKFLAILDGDYYQQPYKGFTTKIDWVNNQLHDLNKSKAITINDI